MLLIDDRAPTESYNVRYRILGTRTWSIDQVPHLETGSPYHGHTITGLAAREGYEFQVAAVNANGVGPYSVSTIVVPHPDVSVPVDAENLGDSLYLGKLGVHWTDEINSDMINRNSVGSNVLHGNSCYGPVGFKVSWDRAGSADEFQFHIDTNGGAGEVSYEVTRDGFVGGDGYRSMYGSVRMFGPGSVTIYARAKHGEDRYSAWTNPAGLYCTEDPLPFTEELKQTMLGGSTIATRVASVSARQSGSLRSATQQEDTAEENVPATGRPVIVGDPNQGETLTVSTGDIIDADGMENSAFLYRWFRFDGTDNGPIADATSSTLALTGDHVGDAITVEVSFTDDLGNDETVTSDSVLVETVEPLAGFIDDDTVPSEHDGSQSFTFQLYFSEEPALGYENVKEHVLTVTGGTVNGASRTQSGDDTRWTITITPSGDDDVTIVLPETTDCSNDGAVCTASDKMLTIGDSTTVPGPEEQEDDPPETVPTDPPAAPTNLTGLIDADGNITITWTGPGGDSITGYQILRRRPQWEEHELEVYVDDTGNTAASYTDTGTPENTPYVYRVKARNAAGLSEWSNFVKIDKTNHG